MWVIDVSEEKSATRTGRVWTIFRNGHWNYAASRKFLFLIDDQKVVMMSLKMSAIQHCCSEVAELILCDYGNCGTSMIT